MVLHYCPRCDYKTHIQSDLKRHLRRKRPCTIIKAYVDREEYIKEHLYAKKSVKDKKLTPKIDKLTPTLKKLTPKLDKLTPKNTFDSLECSEYLYTSKYTCKYCGKSMSKSSNLDRHKLICTAKKIQLDKDRENNARNDILQTRIELANLKEEIIKLKSAVGIQNNTNIHNDHSNTHNTNNNINIENINISLSRDDFVNEGNNELLSFGCERLDHLDLDKIRKRIQDVGVYYVIPEIIQEIFLNCIVPENMNVKYPNRNRPQMQVYKQGSWIMHGQKEVMRKLGVVATSVCDDCVQLDNAKKDYIEGIPTTVKRINNDIINVFLTFKVNKRLKNAKNKGVQFVEGRIQI